MRRHKNENEFITFISPEGVQAIKSYLRVERHNLEDSQPLFTKYKSSNDPMEPIAIVNIYSRLCDGLGWTKEGNSYRKITGHMGRKWIKTNLTNAGMPREPLETLLGHKLTTGTDDNYYIMNEDHLKSIYLKYLPNITIYPTEAFTVEDEGYSKLSSENKVLKDELKQIRLEKDEQYEKLKREIEAILDIQRQ